jgi:hypothetical protein
LEKPLASKRVALKKESKYPALTAQPQLAWLRASSLEQFHSSFQTPSLPVSPPTMTLHFEQILQHQPREPQIRQTLVVFFQLAMSLRSYLAEIGSETQAFPQALDENPSVYRHLLSENASPQKADPAQGGRQ